ncbi:hypothetical protein D3C86_2173250 [compost metagenome]
MFAHVGKRELNVLEFRHAEDVGEQFFREADAACADDSDFETHDPCLNAIKFAGAER